MHRNFVFSRASCCVFFPPFFPPRLFHKGWGGRKEGIESTSILKIELLRSAVAIIMPFDFTRKPLSETGIPSQRRGSPSILERFNRDVAATTFHFFRSTFPPALSLVFRSRSTQQSKWQRQPPSDLSASFNLRGF